MLVYDCEIVKAIPSRDTGALEGIEYCAGWHDHANMGISVIGAYDYDTGRYRVFCADNFGEFEDLAHATDLLVGFNNVGFDDKLIGASGLHASPSTPRYDLLAESWVAAGLAPTWQSFDTHGGFGLDAICSATFARTKTGHGALAPVDWQRGRVGSVIDYCLADVWLTKQLFDLALAGKPIINPKTGEPMTLREPKLRDQ